MFKLEAWLYEQNGQMIVPMLLIELTTDQRIDDEGKSPDTYSEADQNRHSRSVGPIRVADDENVEEQRDDEHTNVQSANKSHTGKHSTKMPSCQSGEHLTSPYKTQKSAPFQGADLRPSRVGFRLQVRGLVGKRKPPWAEKTSWSRKRRSPD